ncbi:MAG TPA: methylated-DNA--[protein]-cysteine S-methyltransferase [Mycobacteriales bacterium]|nr:methylated-DNA--[protein]-cysteine S-methyltransferase [Mycobacteriales bacterium]
MFLSELFMSTVDTPVGGLSLVADPMGVVRAAGFGPPQELVRRLGAATNGAATGKAATHAAEVTPRADLGPVTRAVRAYLAGDLDALDDLPVEQQGGPFLQRAWKVLREVPAGSTVSYTELAALAGSPTAVRAAGQACARNLVAPIVPCHRVLRSDGSLGGYAYGLPIKRWLLDHELRGTSSAASAHAR